MPMIDHPEFPRIARIATESMIDAARQLDCESELNRVEFERQVNRVADQLAALLLRAWKINHS